MQALVPGARGRLLLCPLRYRLLATATPATSSSPPLLLKLRADLKTAMKEKDTNRLNVLRAIFSDVTNSAKTSSPVKTDMQLLSILKKRAGAARAAEAEFEQAGRHDLVEREREQANVLEEYAGGVQTMSNSEIREVVVSVVNEIKAEGREPPKINQVLKNLLSPGGRLDGRPADKADVANIVKEVLA